MTDRETAADAAGAAAALREARWPSLTTARPLDVVAGQHELKRLVLAGDWALAASRAAARGAKARDVGGQALDELHALGRVRAWLDVLERVATREQVRPAHDLINVQVEDAQRVFDANLSACLDADRIAIHARVQAGRPPEPAPGWPARARRLERATARLWARLHLAARGAAERGFGAGLERIQAAALDHLFAVVAANRDAEAFRPELISESRDVLLALGRTERHLWGAIAACGWLRREAALDPAPLVEAARTLRLRPEPTPGHTVPLRALLGQPEARDGEDVIVAGMIAEVVRIEAATHHLTRIALHDPADRTRSLTVKAPYVDLTQRGLVVGGWLQCAGRFSATAAWAEGAPGLQISRAARASAPSWADRMLHVIRPVFDVCPGGLHVEWSTDAVARAHELVATLEVRMFRDARQDEAP